MVDTKVEEADIQVSSWFKWISWKFQNFIRSSDDDFQLSIQDKKFQYLHDYFGYTISFVTILFVSGFIVHTCQEFGL